MAVLHLLATWAEKRGWVYYRQLGGRGVFAAMSNAMAEFEVVVNPAAEHRLEERSQRLIASEAASGRLAEDDD